MLDNSTSNDSIDVRTRAHLAYIFSISSIIMIFYIIYMWGNQTEILTLIIGLIGGTMLGSVSGMYFGGSTSGKKPDTSVQGDNTLVINKSEASTDGAKSSE